MIAAKSIQVRGVVQGVGFRPFVFRLAHANSLAGWVLNEDWGVAIHVEGSEPAVETFLSDLALRPPSAAQVASIEVQSSTAEGLRDFTIKESRREHSPSVRISPDLCVCAACLAEMFDPDARRYRYPHINCTECGPRYSIVESLPYDRQRTTMKQWQMDPFCTAQYDDPTDRRFHAQPIACAACGPHCYLETSGEQIYGDASLTAAAHLLKEGWIVAVKGIGGYHLACDARNPEAVRSLRKRKFRKEKPFALMARDLDVARACVELSADAETLLNSVARPIVLARAKIHLDHVAPESGELGVMLPYTPVHHLLYAGGAPDLLVMTSANRSSEPIAYLDSEAKENLAGIADAFLISERPIARRVDDSVVCTGVFGPVILRRSRGYAPGVLACMPSSRPVLAVGADLKNTVTFAVDGQALVSQHLGDLDHYASFQAFQQTIDDLSSMYEIDSAELMVAHDAHPQYRSTAFAHDLPAYCKIPIQHHRAHIASVLAERQAWETEVIGVGFDGTGFGDDGAIWGGEFFVGSIATGFCRTAHLRKAYLPGGDAAAMYPVQCAAGFLRDLGHDSDLEAPPFHFPKRYRAACELLKKNMRTFETTSIGRLFDAAAALLGFTREINFEGQAAMWLEHLARSADVCEAYDFPFDGYELDYRPMLESIFRDRMRRRRVAEVARAFHEGVAAGLARTAARLCEQYSLDIVVISGGVFQNQLLLEAAKRLLERQSIRIWTNSAVPPNDGGVSLGQAALAVFGSS